MNWIAISKFVVKAVTRYSVSQVVTNVIDYTTPIGASRGNVIVSKIGGIIVSSMVADKAVDYVMTEIESVIPAAKETEK